MRDKKSLCILRVPYFQRNRPQLTFLRSSSHESHIPSFTQSLSAFVYRLRTTEYVHQIQTRTHINHCRRFELTNKVNADNAPKKFYVTKLYAGGRFQKTNAQEIYSEIIVMMQRESVRSVRLQHLELLHIKRLDIWPLIYN